MSIDVLLGDARAATPDVADRIVIVIDVLRAATSVAVALSSGANDVRPFLSVAETLLAAEALASSVGRSALCLAGERHAVRIDGFDLGNSPLEMTRAAVGGKAMLFTTTNGTAALIATRAARASFFASFVNSTATVHAALSVFADAPTLTGFTIVCAGHEGALALEDVVCAGRLVRGLVAAHHTMTLTDRARVAVAAEAPYARSLSALAQDAGHARTLATNGFARDVEYCLAIDTVPTAVRFDGAVLAFADRSLNGEPARSDAARSDAARDNAQRRDSSPLGASHVMASHVTASRVDGAGHGSPAGSH